MPHQHVRQAPQPREPGLSEKGFDSKIFQAFQTVLPAPEPLTPTVFPVAPAAGPGDHNIRMTHSIVPANSLTCSDRCNRFCKDLDNMLQHATTYSICSCDCHDPLVQPLVWAPSLEPSALATQSPNDAQFVSVTCLVWDGYIPYTSGSNF